MDLRLPPQHTLTHNKTYKGDTQFNSITTTADGRLAIGSNQGVVRLYNQVGNRATNNFYTLGKQILMMDSTKDGKYLLITTPSSLFLINTQVDTQNSYKDAYSQVIQHRTGNRPIPIEFTLHVQDLHHYHIQSFSFNKARFDECQQEQYIIASFNQFVATWAIDNILQGRSDIYTIQ